MLNNIELTNIISYLTTVTNYTKESLLRRNHDSLFRMYMRIKSCMSTYPLDILSLQKKVNLIQYNLTDLTKMNYHELCSLKKNLENNMKRKKNTPSIDDETEEEYREPILISPDDLYISYLIDYHNYTESELLEQGFILVDKDQDAYLTYIRSQLKMKIINILKRKNSSTNYEMMGLEQLIDLYFKIFGKDEDYVSIDDMVDEIKLEKRWQNE